MVDIKNPNSESFPVSRDVDNFADPSNPSGVTQSVHSPNENIEDPIKDAQALPGEMAELPSTIAPVKDTADHKKQEEEREILAKRRFLRDKELSMFPDDFLIINDIALAGVPVTSINITKKADVFIAETIRSEAPITQPLGRNNIALSLSLVFPPGEEQSVKLRRLMAELQYNPLVYIYNNKIRKDLGVGIGIHGDRRELVEENTATTMFILESGVLRNADGMVGTLLLDLNLHYFNYKPFSKHCWFNADLPSLRDRDQVEITIDSNIDLDELQGYEASAYVLNEEAKRLMENTYVGILNADPKQQETYLPVAFPSASKAYTYYADFLSDRENIPTIMEYPSDYVGFEITKFEYYNPPNKEAWAGNDAMDMHRNLAIPETQDRYNADKETLTATQKKAEAAAGGRQSKRNVSKVEVPYTTKAAFGSEEITFVFLKYHHGSSVGTYDGDIIRKARGKEKTPLSYKGTLFHANGAVNEETRRVISQFGSTLGVHQKHVPLTKRVHKDLIGLLQEVANHYPGKSIKIISTLRPHAAEGTMHVVGTAMDLKVSGVSDEELFIFGMQLQEKQGRGGVGFYDKPGNHFVHLDARTKAIEPKKSPAFWVNVNTEDPLYGGKSKWEVFSRIEADYVDAINISAAEDQDPELAQEAQQARAKAEQKQETESADKDDTIKNAKARREWIKRVRIEEGVRYYTKDVAVKNVFYRTISKYIDSSPLNANLYKEDNLQNIVCTGMTVTFGHRIVPMRLIGQDTPTWQFLGAGNKAGSMVFSFSGAEGRRSANYIKKMIQYSHENARVFSSLIKEAGSIKLIWKNYESNQINSILALLNINDIVVTNISESNIPGNPDSFQMSIDFVNQDFMEEGLTRKSLVPLEFKDKVIKKIMSYLKVEKKDIDTNSFQELLASVVHKEFYYSQRASVSISNAIKTDIPEAEGTVQAKEGYRFPEGFPIWLADVIIAARNITQEANEEAPPTSWIVDKKTGETWQDRYGKFEAAEKVFGHITNIAFREDNNKNRPFGVSSEDDQRDFRKGTYELKHNGGPATNRIHARVFIRWLDKMSYLVDEVRKNVTDEENFKEYFGNLGEELTSRLVEDLGECYADMKLPKVPGLDEDLALSLPPEFYFYNDSHEDAAIAGMADGAAESFAAQHFINERTSIEAYMSKKILGGAYLSANMDKIINNRRGWNEQFGAEWDFNFAGKGYVDGLKIWEPAFHRPEEENTTGNVKGGAKNWRTNVALTYGAENTEESVQSKFMEEVVRLSPYLNTGRKWLDETRKGNLAVEDQEIVSLLYGKNHNKITFGPNQRYVETDRILRGNYGLGQDGTQKDFLATAKEEAKASGKNVQIEEDAYVAPDGSTIAGDKSKRAPKRPSPSTDSYAAYQAKKLLEERGELKRLTAEDLSDKEVSKGLSKRLKEISEEEKTTTIADKINNSKDHVLSEENKDEAKRAAKMAIGIALGGRSDDLNMRRVFPTFKIYFIEEDSEQSESVDGRLITAFDDFYSYAAVQEIKIIRSRKIPADLAIVRMTNVGGKLFRKRFGVEDPKFTAMYPHVDEEAEYATGYFADTKKENPFEKLVLQDGVKVQIRLGYCADPDHLETQFLGQVVEVAPSDDQRIIQIVLQGYGAELDNIEQGELNDGARFYSTQAALSAAIIQPHIANFGHWGKHNQFNLAEIRSKFTGGQGDSPEYSLINPLGTTFSRWAADSGRELLESKKYLNDPQDDNIYAPPVSTYSNWWEQFYNNACLYRPIKQTAWQIFKEHELRHPGYIAMAVPYGHSSRMTMFFGPKYQHYWSSPVSSLELHLAESAEETIVSLRGLGLNRAFADEKFKERLNKIMGENPVLGKAIYKDLLHQHAPKSTAYEIGKIFGRYKPFRNYHYVDSEHHILENHIRTSRDGTFNEIELRYMNNEDILDPGFLDRAIEGGSTPTTAVWNAIVNADEVRAGILKKGLASMDGGNEGLLTVKLDENIPPEYIRSYTDQYPSCVTDYMAKRYTQGLFARFLKDAYKGELVLVGNEKMKPCDVILLNDQFTQMTGPVEIESVTHVFNRELGFRSIVTPDLCVDVNEFYSASTMDLLNSIMGTNALIFGSSAAAGVAAGVAAGAVGAGAVVALAALPLATFALMGGVKFVQWTQEGAPVMTTPLTLGGKPFMAVSLGPKNSSFFLKNWKGELVQWYDDTANGYAKMDIGESISDFANRANLWTLEAFSGIES